MSESDNHYRYKALEQYGEECKICGVTERIEVHHIDGDHGNNSVDNLLPVCRDCHNSIHTGGIEPLSELVKPIDERDYFPVNDAHRPEVSEELYGIARDIQEDYGYANIDAALKHVAREAGYDV